MEMASWREKNIVYKRFLHDISEKIIIPSIKSGGKSTAAERDESQKKLEEIVGRLDDEALTWPGFQEIMEKFIKIDLSGVDGADLSKIREVLPQ